VGEGQFVLGPASGLIGSPQYGTQDAKDRKLGRSPRLVAKSLLQPLLSCGSAVKIDSEAYRIANYRVEKVTHTGDTHGKDWYTSVELKPVGEASPNKSGYEPDPDPEVLE
jgi:hypothetical protein